MTLYFEEIDPDDDTPVNVPDGDWQPSADSGSNVMDLGDMTGFVTGASAVGAADAAAAAASASASASVSASASASASATAGGSHGPARKKDKKKAKRKAKQAATAAAAAAAAALTAGEVSADGAWTCACRAASANFPARGGCTATMVGSSMFVVAGADRAGNHMNDVHVLDTTSWEWRQATVAQDDAAAALSPRSGHSAVACGSYLVIFGGANMSVEACYNDVCLLATGIKPPPPTHTHTRPPNPPTRQGGMRHPRSHRVPPLLPGTRRILPCTDPADPFAALRTDSDELTWAQADPSGPKPTARNSHSATMVSPTAMVVFGGASETGPLNDVHVLDLSDLSAPVWAAVQCRGQVPAAREMHTATLWPTVDAMAAESAQATSILVLGGRVESGEVLADAWSLAPDTWTWTEVNHTMPTPRCAHVAEVVNSQVVLFGGIDGAGLPEDLMALDDGGWGPVETVGSTLPPPRFGHAGTVAPGVGMLIFGGISVTDDLLDTWGVAFS